MSTRPQTGAPSTSPDGAAPYGSAPRASTAARARRRERWAERDRAWATWVYSAGGRPRLVPLLCAVSRVSDGMVWYTLIVLLPWLGGPQGLQCALAMLALGTLDLVVYKLLKRGTARARPCLACPGIEARMRSLDEYSFPSGHTLHAVAFSSVLTFFYPAMALLLWPFTLLVALSRVVLGLHYPSDVAVGALLGALMAQAVLAWF